MNKTESLRRDNHEQPIDDWSPTDYARNQLPSINHSKSHKTMKVHFPVEY